MQTFLPYRSFEHSARVLDRKRLGKQRTEAYQILKTLLGLSDGWKNHPAVKLWAGHEIALCCYGLTMCMEWRNRGYRDSLRDKFIVHLDDLCKDKTRDKHRPAWCNDEEFHIAHRSNLVRKAPEIYEKHWPEVSNKLPYIWPKAYSTV